MQMPIQSFLGSLDTASHADPKLVEFEAMDFQAQLEKLERLVETPSKAKSGALNEALSRIKVWQTTDVPSMMGKKWSISL